MDGLVERLNSYRPTNEWGDGVHHVICTEAATELLRLQSEVDALCAAANEYLDNDGSRGTFDALQLSDARKRINAILSGTPTPRNGLLDLVIKLHVEGALSEGQVAHASGLDRVEIRRRADELRA